MTTKCIKCKHCFDAKRTDKGGHERICLDCRKLTNENTPEQQDTYTDITDPRRYNERLKTGFDMVNNEGQI